MAGTGFNWKSIFINDPASETPEKQVVNVPPPSDNKFPSGGFAPLEVSSSQGNPHIEEIVGVYEKGFESLNSPNFDFFEFYKSVLSVGVNNAQSYQMAFAMGSALNKDLSKDFLLQKSIYYISEIEKVHKGFLNTGTTKSKEISTNIGNQKATLKSSIDDIESKIVQLQKDLIDKKAELEKLETGNSKEYVEIQQKLEANEFAKEKMLQSIKQVVNGINQYL
ncbi:MAG: hypothetical protein ACRCVT_12070 [Leadbetterella sp.]